MGTGQKAQSVKGRERKEIKSVKKELKIKDEMNT
jgi:hypothetical protein